MPKPKPGKEPNWPREGDVVDYHSVIGGEITKKGLKVTTNPTLLGGHTWVVWVEGISGCVAVTALSKSQ